MATIRSSLVRRLRPAAVALCVALPAAVPAVAHAQGKPTIDQFLSPGFPSELVSAKKADRIAWLTYERGQRNVYTAVAPDFKPVRLTKFLDDDGVTLSELSISDDGSIVTFVRGSEPNGEGWIANPSSNPNGGERDIWVAHTNGTGAWRVIEGNGPVLSPDGHSVLFVHDNQIYRAATTRTGTTATIDRAELPFIKEFGRNSAPHWSPDGSKIAFVSARTNHALVGVYDMKTHTVHYVSPSVDFDGSPTWSSDGKHIAFIRRPGTPFGQQAQAGNGSLGQPGGPASQQGAAGRGGRGGNGGRAGGGGRGANGAGDAAAPARPDGLYRAAFRGGYTISLMVAEVDGDTAREVWHNEPNARTFAAINGITWAGDNLIFQQEPEEWIRYYSVSANGGTGTPIELTPGDGALETLGLSSDGKTLYYASNVGDIDRRHVWKVQTAGGPAVELTKGDEIEMYPAPLASGKQLAVLTSAAMQTHVGRRPPGVGRRGEADLSDVRQGLPHGGAGRADGGRAQGRRWDGVPQSAFPPQRSQIG